MQLGNQVTAEDEERQLLKNRFEAENRRGKEES
jgi:hypothetical protein